MFAMRDVFGRFGNLIDVYMLSGKICGYAKYASKESAEQAMQVIVCCLEHSYDASVPAATRYFNKPLHYGTTQYSVKSVEVDFWKEVL